MQRRTRSSTRVLPDGTPLQNRLLAALPTVDYNRIAQHLRLTSTVTGDTLHEDGRRIDVVYFPSGGVFSITNRMRDGALVEVATVGREGMLGIGAFLGIAQAPDGPFNRSRSFSTRSMRPDWSPVGMGGCAYSDAAGWKQRLVNVMPPFAAISRD